MVIYFPKTYPKKTWSLISALPGNLLHVHFTSIFFSLIIFFLTTTLLAFFDLVAINGDKTGVFKDVPAKGEKGWVLGEGVIWVLSWVFFVAGVTVVNAGGGVGGISSTHRIDGDVQGDGIVNGPIWLLTFSLFDFFVTGRDRAGELADDVGKCESDWVLGFTCKSECEASGDGMAGWWTRVVFWFKVIGPDGESKVVKTSQN